MIEHLKWEMLSDLVLTHLGFGEDVVSIAIVLIPLSS